MIRAVVLFFAVTLTACAPTYELTNKFEPAEAAFALKRGSGTVTGQAFLRQRGGGVVTCAGSPVVLMPSTKYTDEIFAKSFGSPDGGLAGVFAPYPADQGDKRLAQYTRKAQCDASGNFIFAGVPAGTYWALSKVTWSVGNSIVPEGGLTGRKVQVRSPGTVQVLLTQ